MGAALFSPGTAASGGTGRYSPQRFLNLTYVRENLDALKDGSMSVVLQQSAVAKRHLGGVPGALALWHDRCDRGRKNVADRKHLGHALETSALLAGQIGDHGRSIAVLQEAFAAYRGVELPNRLRQNAEQPGQFLSQRSSLESGSTGGHRRRQDCNGAECRLDSEHDQGFTSERSRRGKETKARPRCSGTDALEIARRTRNSVIHFQVEFQLFKLAIGQETRPP